MNQRVFPWLWARPQAPGESLSWPVSEAPKPWRPELKGLCAALWLFLHSGCTWATVDGSQEDRERGWEGQNAPTLLNLGCEVTVATLLVLFVSGAAGADVGGIPGRGLGFRWPLLPLHSAASLLAARFPGP